MKRSSTVELTQERVSFRSSQLSMTASRSEIQLFHILSSVLEFLRHCSTMLQHDALMLKGNPHRAELRPLPAYLYRSSFTVKHLLTYKSYKITFWVLVSTVILVLQLFFQHWMFTQVLWVKRWFRNRFSPVKAAVCQFFFWASSS